MSLDRSEAALAALQEALAGEHATVFAYGLAGARVDAARRAGAFAAYEVHLDQRDRLTALLVDVGEDPVTAEPAYAFPFPVRVPADAARLAGLVEDRLCAPYAKLVGEGTGDLRALAAEFLQGCAVRAALWRGELIRPFPGDPSRG